MSEQKSFSLLNVNVGKVNLGSRRKSANGLMTKIWESLGGAASVVYAPTRERRFAKAKADVDQIKAESQIEITDLQRRATRRRLAEDAKQQENMEGIAAKAFPDLKEDAKPESMDNDWVANFLGKARIVSDEEMQSLWARVLAGEANAPGTFSKRTVNCLADLNKSEAVLFTRFCGFVWEIASLRPLVFDYKEKIYSRHGINFDRLTDLENIGLIQFSTVVQFKRIGFPKRISVFYFGRQLVLEFPKDADNEIIIGQTQLTRIGQELAPICGSEPVEGFWEYMRDHWKQYLPK